MMWLLASLIPFFGVGVEHFWYNFLETPVAVYQRPMPLNDDDDTLNDDLNARYLKSNTYKSMLDDGAVIHANW